MRIQNTRREVLKGIGGVAGIAVLGSRRTSARPAKDRFVVDTSTMELSALSGMEIVYDFRSVTPDGDGIEYAVVRGSESAMPDEATYAPDLTIEIETPQQQTMEMDAREAAEPFYDLQWDKQEQSITEVHDAGVTGAGTRIGIIDDGVLGANPERDVEHPDLPRVRADLSANFTDDGNGPGPLNDDHGTHCAGTAAAAANGAGVVGMAPDAEIVDLRVFSGEGASFADITAAVLVGAAPEGVPVNVGTAETPEVYDGAGCDVLNLSLGTGPLPPTEGVKTLTAAQSATAQLALDFGALPIASAGNDSTNLDSVPDGFDESVINLPSEADGYMSIGAAGPIGFGWPAGQNPKTVAGLEVSRAPRVELPTEEPAFYTNYGAEGVDVTAGGGNADLAALNAPDGPNAQFDLVFNTGIDNLDPDVPEDTVLNEYVPGYVFKAGTSFSAPNVAGFAALLYGDLDDPTPETVRDRIESTARPANIGRAAETTAPGQEPNVATDDTFDGDKPSNPGSVPGRIDPEEYRGEGHIDIPAALGIDDEDEEDDEDGGNGNGNGNGN